MFEDELNFQEQSAEKIGSLNGMRAQDVIENLGGPWNGGIPSCVAASADIERLPTVAACTNKGQDVSRINACFLIMCHWVSLHTSMKS